MAADSEMVERVARAIGGEVEWHRAPELCSQSQLARRDEHRRLARVAILAMREPTEEMVKSCCDGDDSWNHCIRDDDGRVLWREMIDAALSQKQDGKEG